MAAEVEGERIYTIPLRIKCPRWKRAPRAIKEVRSFVAKNMGVGEETVWIDSSVNELIWRRGIEKPPSRVRVKVSKFSEDLVEVKLISEIVEEKAELEEEEKMEKEGEKEKEEGGEESSNIEHASEDREA